ncbi:hypothetical protein ACFSC4_27800 [Deinococcus malanensis]|uniref:hypothetical protein n=1 Tax=Deinococcus malanensis TaxID=1706855 RepID=UPI00362C486F
MSFLSLFAEAINDGFVAVDSNWQVTFLNRQARLMLRHPNTDSQINLQDLIPDDPTTSTWRELRRALDQQVTVEIDVFYPAFFSWHEVRAFPWTAAWAWFCVTSPTVSGCCARKPNAATCATSSTTPRSRCLFCAGRNTNLNSSTTSRGN